MPRVSLLVVLVLAAACNDDATKTPPRQVKKRVDTERIPAPNHSPEVLMNPGKPRRVSTKGTMEADLSGRRQHFVFFPRGSNAAVFDPDTKVAWLEIEAALSDEGTPALSFQLEPLRLDQVEFPATFVAGEADDAQPQLEVQYVMGTERWSSEVESERPMRITLEALEGRELRGTFEGTLPPQAQNPNEPIEVAKGSFAIELRLKNVEQGEAAEESAKPKAKAAE